MRIAFVEDILRFSIPLGITGVAAMLRQGGHDVRVFVVGREIDGTLDRIAAWKADAVAFSVISGRAPTCGSSATGLPEEHALGRA